MTDPHMFVSINDSRTCFRCGEELAAEVHADPPQADVDAVLGARGVTVEPYQPQKVTAAELGRSAAAALLLHNAAQGALGDLRQDAFHYYGQGRDHRAPAQPEAACPACQGSEAEVGVCERCGRLLGLGTLQQAQAAQEHVEGEVLSGELKPDRGLRGQASEHTQAVLASFTRPRSAS